jgi:hypothetical protein
MAEIRVQVAYHFKVDPAKLVPGIVRLPEQIIRTVSAGDEFTTEKVSLDSLQESDRASLEAEIEKQVREATRTARPVIEGGAHSPDPGAEVEGEGPAEEVSAF